MARKTGDGAVRSRGDLRAAREGSVPRQVACQVLMAVEKGQHADAALARRLATHSLNPLDVALATRLVYGTLAWQGYLDYLITAVSRPPEQLDAPVRIVLRVALFQLTKLSRIPDFAAVNTAVELAKASGHEAAASLVNAALRRFLRERERYVPVATGDTVADLAITASHPPWLVELWLRELGAEVSTLLQVNNEAAPTALRINRLRAERDTVLAMLNNAGIAARAATFAPQGVVLESGRDLTTLPGYTDGLFTSQGEASQLVSLIVGAQPGDRIWDVCAAPGGKSTHIGEQLGNRGRVQATDVNRNGLRLLRDTARRLGLTCIDIVAADARAVDWRAPFDAVLVDAPCSGLGTLRQHPEIKWRRTPEDMTRLAAQQAQLLDHAARAVRPGGVLVYATCTIAHVENEDVIAGFLATHPDFTIVDPTALLPPPARRLVDKRGFFHSFPHRDNLDGFFAARLKRQRESRMLTA